MKKPASLLLACAFLAAGCSATRTSAINPAYQTEVVEADGLAPVVDGNLDGARKTSLGEAMKAALGLVVGIYVSQEALVSQAVLIDENITSRSEGYIEKYEILKEGRDGEFYKTRIRAHVRKEDLTAKLQTLESEPRKLGNPVIGFDIKELADPKQPGTAYAQAELTAAFTEAGFMTGEKEKADIVIKGEASASFNTREGLGGLVSYRAGVSLSAVKTGSADSLGAQQESAGGMDVNDAAAARAAIINAAKKAAGPLKDKVLKSLREKTMVRLNLANVKSMNDLGAFTKALRNIPAVRDSWVRSYSGETAALDVGMRKGGAADLSQLLSKSAKPAVRIDRASAYALDATLQ